MGAVDRGVDADRPVQIAGRVGIGEEPGMDPIPGAVAAEPLVSLPDGRPRAEATGKVTPRDTGPEPIDDPLDHLTVIAKRSPSLPIGGRQQVFNPGPLSVAQNR